MASKLAILLLVLAAGASYAQELPRPSLAREETGTKTLPTDYNLKLGAVLFDFNASEETDFVDNIGLSHSNKLSDVIVTPSVGIGARWPVTASNTLELSTSLGYTKYLFHPEFDTSNVIIAPDSKLSFDVFIGNFKINFHDAFSYQQDPVEEAALTNVVNFSRFNNDAGVSVLWDLNKIVLNVNYDHITFIADDLQTTDGQFINDPGSLSFEADQVSASAELHATSSLIAGLEGAASQRTYNQESGEYDQLSAGPYVKFQVTEHLKCQLSGGYQYLSNPDSLLPISPKFIPGALAPSSGQGSSSSYYFDLAFDNQLNNYYTHRLDLGHNLSLGLLGEESETSYVNYTGSWRVNTHLNVAFTLGYADVTETGGLVTFPSYQSFNAGVQASFPVTPSISGAVIYQFTDKIGDQSFSSYEQNRIGLLLTYHF